MSSTCTGLNLTSCLFYATFSDLAPVTIIGGTLGAAAVYGIDQGDIMAAKKDWLPKFRKRIRHVKREVASLAADLQQDLEHLKRKHMIALDDMQREVRTWKRLAWNSARSRGQQCRNCRVACWAFGLALFPKRVS